MDHPPARSAADAVPFALALRVWLKIGCLSFGGPAGQIALMHEELVVRRRWISEARFLHALNYCMVLPGPEAQQLATYLGWLMHRTWGGLLAGVLFILPGLLLLTALTAMYAAWGSTPAVTAIFAGIQPAVLAVVLAAAWRLGQRTLRDPLLIGIAAAALLGLVLGLHFALILGLAALSGWIGAKWRPQAFAARSSHAGAGSVHARGPALIDDDTPTPAHARPDRRRLLRVLLICLALWLLPVALLAAVFGGEHAYVQMALFFTQAALLTFGGAYAVLPYVWAASVDTHGWLSTAQMIHGIALAEATPGPLILVVSHVGFLGGWNGALLGPDALLPAGVLGALMVAWVSFLPSFLFILAGGPLLESSRDQLRLAAPLTAISAAVVGVILSLALRFAGVVLWPASLTGGIHLPALSLSLLAVLALIRWSRSPLEVIGAGALLGALGLV
ncbi:MAG: chromate efflux transporter [Xanthomonadales bacterium]|jgi:chromate transporter|nr:chromate efflux transporter [Xanthomonadales bacterium]